MKISPWTICSIAALGLASLCNAEPIADTTEHFQRFTALPVLGYSEETELEYGAMGIIFFRPSFKGGKVGELDFTVYGTTRKQLTAMVSPIFYLFHDMLSGYVDFYYENWVSHYFGVGNNPDIDTYRIYDSENYYVQGELKTSFLLPAALADFSYGINYGFKHSEITFRKIDPDDPANDIKLPGNADGWRNGIGYNLAYDSRDNENWARHGYLVRWDHNFYSDAFGDYSYTTQSLDLRGYSEFIWNTSMAVALLWKRTDGDAPFDELAGPNGIKRFRGVEINYFSGNQALILQAEFRKELFWRLAGNIFFEGGKAGDYFSDLMRRDWHRSVGFGGQLALNTSERLYARGDISWVDFNKIGLTVYIREAF